jgi:hypothetical protein
MRASADPPKPPPGSPQAVSFGNDVMPILCKMGCNATTCHGAAAGKGNFKLSLFGADAVADYDWLTRSAQGRRIDRFNPAQSLLLLKATASIPHQGGKKLEAGSSEYHSHQPQSCSHATKRAVSDMTHRLIGYYVMLEHNLLQLLQSALTPAAILVLVLAPSLPAQTIVREDGRLRIPVGPASAGAPPVLECLAAVGPAIPVTALAFSPDGKRLAAAAGRDVALWDLDAAKLLKRAGAGTADVTVHALAFSKDGHWLAVGEGKPGVSGGVRLVDVQSDQTIAAFPEPKDVVYGLAFSPDGNLLAAGSADGRAYVWNVAQKKLAGTIREHTDWVLGVAFSPDGKLLATASTDRSVQVWEVGTWKSLNRFLQSDPVQAVAFSPDGQLLSWAVAGPQNRMVRWRQPLDPPEEPGTPAAAKKPKVIPQVRNIDTSGGAPLALAWGSVPQGTPPQPRMLVACADKTVKVYDINASQRATLAGHGDWIYAAAISGDGKTFASGSGDGTVRLWQGVENRPLATLVQLSPGKDDWLIVAAAGYFATSSPAAVSWDKKSLSTPPEKLAELLGKPELVRDALTGKPLGAPPLK